MFLNMFIVADNVIMSKKICEELINKLGEYIDKKNYLSNIPYWKIEGVYNIKLELKFNKKISAEILNEFYVSIADKWIAYGNPEDEILFSNNIDGCNFKNNKIIMINVIY